MYRHIGPTMQISENSGLPIAMIPCLHQNNIYIKGSLRDTEPKNIIFGLVQEGYKPLRGFKLPALRCRHIGPRMEISESSGLPIAMVPCLQQINIYIKGSLRDTEPKNIIFGLVQEGYKPLRGFKLPALMYLHIGPTMQISDSSGLPIAMVP